MEQQKFKFRNIVFLGINGIVGAGIFIAPGKAYALLGPYSLVILLLCSFVATIMSLCFAEMAGYFSDTGGAYVYVKNTYGNSLGFQIGVISIFSGCVTFAADVIAVSMALSVFHPWFDTMMGKFVLSTVLVICISLVNLREIKSSNRLNNVLTTIKFLPLVLFIVTGIFFIKVSNFAMPSADIVPSFSFASVGPGFLLLVYAFFGFENIGIAARDMENPVKNIPRAIFTVMIVLTIMYLLIYTNIIGILGSTVLNEQGSPIGSAMEVYMGSWAKVAIVVVSIVSMIGYSWVTAFSAARSIVPLSKDHFLAEKFGNNNKNGIPGLAVMLIMLITLLIIVVGIFVSADTLVFLMSVSAVGRFVQYIVVSFSVLKARKLNMQGTFRLFCAPLMVSISVFISLICLVYAFLKTSNLFLVGVVPFCIFSFSLWFFYSKPKADKWKSLNN